MRDVLEGGRRGRVRGDNPWNNDEPSSVERVVNITATIRFPARSRPSSFVDYLSGEGRSTLVAEIYHLVPSHPARPFVVPSSCRTAVPPLALPSPSSRPSPSSPLCRLVVASSRRLTALPPPRAHDYIAMPAVLSVPEALPCMSCIRHVEKSFPEGEGTLAGFDCVFTDFGTSRCSFCCSRKDSCETVCMMGDIYP